jgi:hypothetical protein
MPDENGNFEFDLDLTNFEGARKEAYLGIEEPDEREKQLQGEEFEAQRPWDDDARFEDLYSPESIWKAKLLIQSEAIEKIRETTYTVAGSKPYVVQILDGGADQPVPWATCSCPNGTARGGRPSCYHTAAVLATILEKDLSDVVEPPKTKRPRGR